MNALSAILRPFTASDMLFTARQLSVLGHLYDNPLKRTSVLEVAAALDVSKPIVTRCCDILIESGLVTKRDDEADRRRVLLRITTAGRRMIDGAIAGMREAA